MRQVPGNVATEAVNDLLLSLGFETGLDTAHYRPLPILQRGWAMTHDYSTISVQMDEQALFLRLDRLKRKRPIRVDD